MRQIISVFRSPSLSTRNQRFAIISSFYVYAAQNFKISFTHPLEMVKRSRVDLYGNSACPLNSRKCQGLLMYSSPVTTQIYDKQLEHGTNKYQEQIRDLLGL